MTTEGAPGRGTISQSEVVLRGIKAMIADGELRAGSRLPVEKDLAERLGVSRGSLREGVRALAVLGVIETRQGDGTYVTDLAPAQLFTPLGLLADLGDVTSSAQLLDVRRVLESESAARAALTISEDDLAELDGLLASTEALSAAGADLEILIDVDSRFHLVVARAAGNPALAALVETLVSRTFRARLWRAIDERGAVQSAVAEHRAILRELRRRDPDRARLRMALHLIGVEDYVAAHPDAGDPVADDPLAPR